MIKNHSISFSTSYFSSLHSKGEKLLTKLRSDGSYKFIIYSDSSNCTSCQMKYNGLWNRIINVSESKRKDLSFYFVYHPSRYDLQTIEKTYKDSHFLYPIYIDKEGYLEKRNPILTNKRYCCLIINNRNKIIYVGNPAKNINDEEQFYMLLDKLPTIN